MGVGSALARSPSRPRSWSQPRRVAAVREAVSHAELIAKWGEGNRPMPQFPVRMRSSTRACTLQAASMQAFWARQPRVLSGTLVTQRL